MREVLRITNPKVAAAFANARQRFLILKLVDREQSLLQFSQASGISLSLLHYHVTQLQKLGLVEVTKIKPRSGRSMKYYRATAKSFFVPAQLVPLRHDLMNALRAGLDRSQQVGENDGVLYSVDGDARPRMQNISGKTRQASLEQWLSLKLSKVDALSLADEIKLLFARYGGGCSGQGQNYLIYCALAPATPHPKSRKG
jgi:predicted ArsR family transcriptional regulator